MKINPQKNTLLNAAKAHAATKAFKRVFFSPTQKEFFPPLFFCFFSRHRTGSVLNRTVSASIVNRFVDKFVRNSDRHELRADRRASGNKVLPKAGVTCFYDTFVLNRTLVFQFNNSAETPRLRQYPNRYKPFKKKTPMNKNILILILTLVYSICSGQTYIEKVDGKTIITGQSYFNDSMKKNESAANDYIGFYQKYISGIRGQECPMYPSCSNYGLKTFSETNFASAFVMTSDRLIRCGHDHNNYSLTLRNNGFKYIDYPAYDKPPRELYYSRNSYYFAYSDTVKADSSFLFIKNLINNQYYQEAFLEIMRIEFKANTFNINLFINKIICLKAIGEYEKALFEYENRCPQEYKSNNELVFQIALIQYKLQNFDQALQLNTIALESCSDKFCKPKIIMLNGLIYANKYDWQNSMYSYQSLSEYDSYRQISNVNFQLAEKAIRLKNKSPSLAGTLSIIPGLGYAYTGHKQTAITAFLVNGLIAYATYTNFKNENYGMGILTGVFNLSFYFGNIYGATKSAKRYNEQQKKSIINKLEFNTNF